MMTSAAYVASDVARYEELTWHDDWTVRQATRGIIWANQQAIRGMHRLDVRVPRGPITGCHVAPQFLSIWPMQKKFCVAGDRTRDLPNRLRLRIKSPTNGPPGGSC
jgi:hypothetical protein